MHSWLWWNYKFHTIGPGHFFDDSEHYFFIVFDIFEVVEKKNSSEEYENIFPHFCIVLQF